MASYELVPFFVLRMDDIDEDSENNNMYDIRRDPMYNNNYSKPKVRRRPNGSTLSSAGRAKAIFTVPADMVPSLIAHPILCRGGVFELVVDQESESLIQAAYMTKNRNGGVTSTGTLSAITKRRQCGTAFLSTEYYSPLPEDTASEISKRLAIRIDNSDNLNSIGSSVLGL